MEETSFKVGLITPFALYLGYTERFKKDGFVDRTNFVDVMLMLVYKGR